MFVCVRDCQCEVSSTGANHHGGLGVGFVGSVDNHLLLPSPFPPYRRHSTPVEQLKFNFSAFVHKIELFVSFPSAPNKCDRKPEPFPTSLFGMVLVVFRQRQHYLHRGKLCLLGKPIQRWQFSEAVRDDNTTNDDANDNEVDFTEETGPRGYNTAS